MEEHWVPRTGHCARVAGLVSPCLDSSMYLVLSAVFQLLLGPCPIPFTSQGSHPPHSRCRGGLLTSQTCAFLQSLALGGREVPTSLGNELWPMSTSPGSLPLHTPTTHSHPPSTLVPQAF